MKLCNECDLNYRISKNKRLLVELTLIQVAQLTTEGDDVSGGRGPKKTIKPVFTQPAAAQQPQAASATQVHRMLLQNVCRCSVRRCLTTQRLLKWWLIMSLLQRIFTALIPELQDYLRGRLKNSKVMMTVRVSEATETVRPVGRVEKFR